jgi:predicted DNA-binding mobile mystery protein A
MQDEFRRRARRDLDEDLRVFRGTKVRRSKWGWLRGVRQALGMRVAEVARGMKMGESEVYRLEISEIRETITLKKLRAAAAAMGCEVVYAVVPAQGTLEDLAKGLVKERLKRKKGNRKRLSGSDPYGLVKTMKSMITLVGWHQGRG